MKSGLNRGMRASVGWPMVGLALATMACGSIQGTYQARPIDNAGKVLTAEGAHNDIDVSADEVTSLSSPNLGVVALTFTNHTEDFIRITGVSLNFDAPVNEQVSIPVGDNISSWADAIAIRNRIRSGSAQLASGVLMPGGSILASMGHFRPDRAEATTGQLAAPAPLAVSEFQVTQAAAESAQIATLVPADHLLAGPFSVPPKLFAKKWILLKSDGRVKSCLDRLYLGFRAGDKPVQRLIVPFRDRVNTSSEWQRQLCAPPPDTHIELGK